ncbi:MAG: Cof-type HAD-IIB family hydrolase [Bacteroides sp.]|nr:Cof-type HAD-IIB family hydrolase [Bacteroides sp.]
MIKALFFDIDGTLVSFKTHEIPVSTVEALQAAKAKGLQILISTGRPNVLIDNLGVLQAAGIIDGYITMNGAYCFVGREVIYKSCIPAADVETIASYCVARHTPCIMVGEHTICGCGLDELVKQIFYKDLNVSARILETPLEEAIVGKEIFQLSPFISLEQEKELAASLPGCEFGRWHPAFADVTARGNTKQKGMDEMARYLGLKIEETMSFGDGGNDIPMLRHAGIGVAMGNAGDEVKAHADYVTTSVDEDGVANALRHFGIL